MLRILLILSFLSIAQISAAALKFNSVEEYLSHSRASGLKANRLINESSPYLLQHAYNPVNWHPWGEEAFDIARKQNKPVFLSIGYSTCHWCHVMAQESFENKAIADYLNKHFVCIKVDREERPDIDNVYMAATELINGSGGWPMTVVMNPDLEPFFAGTYYPPETRNGHRGLKELLIEINRLWNEERARVDEVALNVAVHIRAQSDASGYGDKLDESSVGNALQQISERFDEELGGFSAAPKFPQPGMLAFLLERAEQQGNAKALLMLNKTLTAMAQGGLFDQVGGGFHRYSVDRFWQVPHFEKMLYTQALLASAYLRLYAIEKDSLYREVATATLDFVLREMTSPGGGFYSAINADSERPDKKGEYSEGAYYLWNEKELKKLLSADELEFSRQYFNVQQQGNIASDPQQEFTNLNILYVSDEFADVDLTEKQQQLRNSITRKLLLQREKRPYPHLDDKVITAWNGMMIAAFADASEILGDKKYLDAAINAAGFVRSNLLDKKTMQLNRRIRGDKAGIEAGLNDYAWYINGLIHIYKVSKDKQWLKLATALALKQETLFLDQNRGGYFDSSGKDTALLFRSKSIYDGALPATNAVVLFNLNELYKITKNKTWKSRADELVSAFAAAMNNDPAATAMALGVYQK